MSRPDYRAAREKSDPRRIGIHIRILWIAESPPASGGYFYFEEASSTNFLFVETMRALNWWRVDQVMKEGYDKKSLLMRFQKAGYFLVDLVQRPINNVPDSVRDAAIQAGISRLALELKSLDPRNIIVVKAPLYGLLLNALRGTPYSDRLLNRGPIPFPNNGHQPKYRRMIADCISRARS